MASASWWAGAAQDRVEVIPERGHTYSGYLHPARAPGTCTVRWQASAWGDPAPVTVDVTLDRGTDRERRWRFTRLILPGSPPAILGTFDVDP